MSARDRDRWNEKYAKCESTSIPGPDQWLVEALQLIETAAAEPESCPRALDVACGLGHNAIWLAQRGWRCDAVDISLNGLELAQGRAAGSDADVAWINADLDDWVPAANAYDLAVVFRFLDRETVPRILRTALRPGGWLVYETFSAAQCDRPDSHIRNPAFVLLPGELAAMFPEFDVVIDREDVLHDRTVRRFLAQKQPAGKALIQSAPP